MRKARSVAHAVDVDDRIPVKLHSQDSNRRKAAKRSHSLSNANSNSKNDSRHSNANSDNLVPSISRVARMPLRKDRTKRQLLLVAHSVDAAVLVASKANSSLSKLSSSHDSSRASSGNSRRVVSVKRKQSSRATKDSLVSRGSLVAEGNKPHSRASSPRRRLVRATGDRFADRAATKRHQSGVASRHVALTPDSQYFLLSAPIPCV